MSHVVRGARRDRALRWSLWSVLGLCATAGCVFQAMPTVSAKKVPPVSPPIQARALLLIAPSFDGFLSEEKSSMHRVRTHFGEATASAIGVLVTGSFSDVATRRLPDAEVQALLAGSADTSAADVLLVPSIDGAWVQSRGTIQYLSREDEKNMVHGYYVYHEMAEVRLRVSARSLRTGRTLAWVTSASTAADFGWGAASGDALEHALHALSDSLAAHRAELQAVSAGQQEAAR